MRHGWYNILYKNVSTERGQGGGGRPRRGMQTDENLGIKLESYVKECEETKAEEEAKEGSG